MHHLSPAQMTDWLTTWGYFGVFGLVFVGNLGIPVPEETVLLVAGFMAGRNELELRTLYLVGVTSAVSGDCFGFGFGRLGGQRLFERLSQRFRFVRDRYDRLQEFFKIHGNKAVFMARFIAGARFMAGPIAGAAGMPFWRFLGWNVLGAMVWCTLIITIGYLVGDELEWVEHVAHRASHWMEAGLVLALVAAFFYWLWDRQQSASRALPPTNN